MGTVRDIEFDADAQVQLLAERFRYGSYGLERGREAPPGSAQVLAGPDATTGDAPAPDGGSTSSRDLQSKERFDVTAGDVLRINTAGGGGYGDPSGRDRDAVERDVANGLVSATSAREDYGAEPEPDEND
jgi:N-methylhydantoinase B